MARARSPSSMPASSAAPSAARERADHVLVARGLFESRAKAQAAIEAGRVRVEGRPLAKASDRIDPQADIMAEPAHPYVSRGGLKLAQALDHFGMDPAGLAGLDVGASTGGFTDLLLRRGAARITAVDVGRGQLHASLRGHPQVTTFEAQDIRSLPAEEAGAPFDLAVVDVSFIPLGHVLPAVMALVRPGGWLLCLVKPQFEVGRGKLDKGIVKDEAARQAALDGVCAAARALGLERIGTIPCATPGGDGNREYWMAARRPGPETTA